MITLMAHDMDMTNITELSALAHSRYSELKAQKLLINMARGRPSTKQLDLSSDLLNLPVIIEGQGVDYRNYGGNRCTPEAQQLMASIMECEPEEVLVEGSSSLALMHDNLVYSFLKGNPDSPRPWQQEERVAFLCPVPGYDFHFQMCESYGINMIPITLNDDGPDMDEVERLVSEDSSIKGIWCIPKYSNPTGCTYSTDVVRRLASMPTAAKDFRIIWDNAYAIHAINDNQDDVLNILDECRRAGCPNRPLAFSSTSKITFPGAGLAAMASSPANLAWFHSQTSIRSIQPDRLNQLRHTQFFPNLTAVKRHMQQHQALIRPKFEIVDTTLGSILGSSGLASWTQPSGGYFVSLYVPSGCARRTIQLAYEAGVELTPAGAAFPYGCDPQDSHIRIAPTSISLDEVRLASEVLAYATIIAIGETGA